MRVSKETAGENRLALLETASRLFRLHGIDGVGVAQIAKEAGLTHGALYAHFSSKHQLAAEALTFGFQKNTANLRNWIEAAHPSFEELSERYSAEHTRDNIESSCPLAASASEIGRQSGEVSENFTSAYRELSEIFAGSLGNDMPYDARRRLGLAAAAAQIGALAVSRAIVKTDPELANEVLRATRDALHSSGKT